MKTIFLGEVRLNTRALLVWSFTVGGLGLVCILLYQSMQGDMKAMADAFSNMGAFSKAFGMSTLSIATLEGYFATEVGTVHGLGSGMFAAILAVGILSKEEEGHTGEFLFSLPVTRKKVLLSKGLCILSMLIIFTVICSILYLMGFLILHEEIPVREFISFMTRQLLMNIEIGGICFGISAISGKNRTGLGIAIALIFYMYDLMGRVAPALENWLFLGPYSYANAPEIFSGAAFPLKAAAAGCCIAVTGIIFAFVCYDRRDLAA